MFIGPSLRADFNRAMELDPAASIAGNYWWSLDRGQLSRRNLSGFFAFARSGAGATAASQTTMQQLLSAADTLRAGVSHLPPYVQAGWLLEPASANTIRNPRQLNGVANTTLPTNFTTSAPAGMTVTFPARGGSARNDGSTGDFLMSGTNTSGALGRCVVWPDGAANQATAPGQAWTHTAIATLFSGAYAGSALKIGFVEVAADGTTILAWNGSAFTPDATFRRYWHSGVVADPACAFVRPAIWLEVPAATAATPRLRLEGVQFENQPFPTSLILPSPAATGIGGPTSRSADSLALEGANFAAIFPGGAPTGCLIVDAYMESVQVLPGGTTRVLLQLDDGSDNNRLQLRPNAAGTSQLAVPTKAGAQGSAATASGAAVYLAPYRIGLRWDVDAGRYGCSHNGAAIGEVSSPGSLPAAFSRLRIGSAHGGAQGFNGRVRRLQAFRHFPGDAEFVARCTSGIG